MRFGEQLSVIVTTAATINLRCTCVCLCPWAGTGTFLNTLRRRSGPGAAVSAKDKGQKKRKGNKRKYNKILSAVLIGNLRICA